MPAILFAALAVAVVAGVSQAPLGPLTSARKALGVERVDTATIEFEYQSTSNGLASGGTGRLLYGGGQKYRIDRVLRRAGRPPWLSVRLEDGAQYATWSVRNAVVTRYPADTPVAQTQRKVLRREVALYLTALLLTETPLTPYKPRDGQPGRYIVQTGDGDDLDVTIAGDRLEEIRYLRPRARSLTVSADSTPVLGAGGTQAARARVSEFRSIAGGRMLPHRLTMTFEQGREELTITRFAINDPIPAGEFQVPPASGR